MGKIILFASNEVGLKVSQFLVEDHIQDIDAIILDEKDPTLLSYLDTRFDKQNIFIYNEKNGQELVIFLQNYKVDYFILAWWGYIIKEPIISLPRIGIVNLHPSLLPYNRGKHYNFWTLVEETPFGVTIHFIDEGIDTGDIIFQRKIEKTWEDTGKTLYEKAKKTIVELFIDNYNNLIEGNYQRQKQDLSKGSFHLAKELEQASKILLEKEYTAKKLLNLLRARTFEPYPACWFEENGQRFEVRVNIRLV